MADLKISQLTAVSEVQGTDVFPTVSGLATMKTSAAQIKTYVTGSLDANDSAVAGSYVTAVSEADGVISVTREAADVKPTANSTKLLTSGGAKAALDEKQDVLTFDSVPTQNSNNPVKSGGVYAEVNSLEETLTKEVTTRATLGAHNLLNTALGARTTNGITFTRNDDGSIVANGTATADAYDMLDNYVYLPAGTYTLSGCPNGGSASKYMLYAEGPTGIPGAIYDYGTTGTNRTFTQSSKFRARLGIVIKSGQTVSNITFYPMLRLVSDTDTTYTPYAATNQQLTGLIPNSFVNGAVNLYKPLISSQVTRGVTFTVNSDGTISTSGTSNALIYFSLEGDNSFQMPTGRYHLSGCPSGGGTNTTFFMYLQDMTATQLVGQDNGTGVDVDLINGHLYRIFIFVGYSSGVGVNMNGKVFKPMLTLADMPNSDYNHYVPYAMSNQEITRKNENVLSSSIATLSNPTNFDLTNATIETIVNAFTRRISIRAEGLVTKIALTAGQVVSIAVVSNGYYGLIVPMGLAYIVKDSTVYRGHVGKNKTNTVLSFTAEENIPIGSTINFYIEWPY